MTKGLYLELNTTIRPLQSFTPVTQGFTVTSIWDNRALDYSDLSNVEELSIKAVATFNNTDTGIIWETGASGDGAILYLFNGTIYFQCGNGASAGPAGNRAEVTYDVMGSINRERTIEVSASSASNTVALYITGLLVDITTVTPGFARLAGGNVGGIGESHNICARNRGGWFTDGTGPFSGTISFIENFQGQLTPDVQ